MLAAAKGNGRRETVVTSAGTNFVGTSQTIANKHASLWPGRAANSLSDVRAEQSAFIAVGGVTVPRVPRAASNKRGAACELRPRLPLGPV